MTIRMLIMLIIVAVVLGGVFGFEAWRDAFVARLMASKFSNPQQTVATMPAAYQEWRNQVHAVGTLRAVNGADLSLEVGGVVEAIHFESGAYVEKGAVLLNLRAQDDIAKLAALQAVADLADKISKRDAEQFKAQAVSQAQLDNDADTLKNDRAQVSEQQAIVDKKVLKAPFSGRLGIRSVDLGQYLTAGTVVVTLQGLDQLYVDFSLPQQALPALKNGQTLLAKVDAYPTQDFAGKIVAIGSKTDTSTRNLQVRGVIENALGKLLPGMYATVTIDVGPPERFITLPQTAITFSVDGDTAYVVVSTTPDPSQLKQQSAQEKFSYDQLKETLKRLSGDKNIPVDQIDALQAQLAQYRPLAHLHDASSQSSAITGTSTTEQLSVVRKFITTGPTRGDQVVVLKGIAEGEQVVVGGQVKLHNGTPVVINNSILPSNEPNPKPSDH